MWHSPLWMSLLARFLFTIGLVLLLYCAYLLLLYMPMAPINKVDVTMPLQRVPASRLATELLPVMQGNFFSMRLDLIQVALEDVPWIRKAVVRRLWPQTLEIHIEEHQPIGRWQELVAADNGNAAVPSYVNSIGELFIADIAKSEAARLPLLSGPPNTVDIVSARYLKLEQKLKQISLRPKEVSLSRRLSLRVVLDNGSLVNFGRERPELGFSAKLVRLLDTYKNITQTHGRPARIDLRYPDGLVVAY